VFCSVIGSQYIVYCLGKVSVFIVTCMAIERWYSVAQPIKYRINFTTCRVTGYLCLAWLLSFTIHIPVFFEMTVSMETKICMWDSAGFSKQALVTISTIVTFFIPIAITWGTYLHIAIKLRSTSLGVGGACTARRKRRLITMCMLVALLLTLCWFPNQLYYVMSSYGLGELETPAHRITVVMVMSNSCFNPFIYCFSNQEYKKAFISLWQPCIKYCRRHGSIINSKETQQSLRSQSAMNSRRDTLY